MIFSIQRYLEDSFNRQQLEDADQYSVRLANLYYSHRSSYSAQVFLEKMHRIRTVFFRSNKAIDRSEFEIKLLKQLDRKFQKKNLKASRFAFPGGVQTERRILSKGRRSISKILKAYRNAIGSRAIDSFWRSRKKNLLKSRPETIAQALLAVFIKGALQDSGLVLREVASGIGFVDIIVILSNTPHLIELKILKSSTIVGPNQLKTYMDNENRHSGWLVLFDVRPPGRKTNIADTIRVNGKTIHVIVVDLNPTPPSKKN